MELDGKLYQPDMEAECRLCGASPCVIVYDPENRHNHKTELCGRHFFSDRLMVDWELWNDQREEL
jgi:hypothetical protein